MEFLYLNVKVSHSLIGPKIIKAGSLDAVKNLNLWGNDIDDLRIFREMPNLEV